MIPKDFITAWRAEAPWVADRQVEQDLAISRAVVELFSHPTIAGALAFRGGTALYKLHLRPAARYSEDIDLVQIAAGGIGEVLDAIHLVLDGWLGAPRWKQTDGRVTLGYRYVAEDTPAVRMKLKLEINTRDHLVVHGLQRQSLQVRSGWFTGEALIPTFGLDELLGTKLRALYQRRKGRDLFDLGLALARDDVSPSRVVEVFTRHMQAAGTPVTRAMFEQNLASKRGDPVFTADLGPLLAAGRAWDFEAMFHRVWNELLPMLPGEAWKGG